MHFIFFIEDQSGKVALDNLIPKIIDIDHFHTYEIHSYKGVGHIPKNLTTKNNGKKATLLNNLPKLLQGVAKRYDYNNYPYSVIVICDLDNHDLKEFKNSLLNILNSCDPKPLNTEFCFAIEEMEAWFLGDKDALLKAYPKSKLNILNKYKQDSICGTWEYLAEIVYQGGVKRLRQISNDNYFKIGEEKINWAKNISIHMDINQNSSKSFNYFKNTLLDLINESK